jgi:hypothetical protein
LRLCVSALKFFKAGFGDILYCKNMEINYELTRDDLIKFYREFATLQATHKPLVFFMMFMYFLFVFADLLYLVFSGTGNFTGPDQIILSFMIRSVIGMGIFCLVYIVSVLLQQNAAKKLDEMQNNGILCEHRIILNENEFIELTDVNTSKHSWLSVGDIKEIDDFVFINVNFVGTHFIPKRFFDDREQIKEFVETARFYRNSAKEKFNSSHLAAYDRETGLLSEGNKNF